MKWANVSDIQEKNYSCGYCGKDVGPSKGFIESSGAPNRSFIYICLRCTNPTFIDGQKNQTPKPLYGNNVDGIADDKIKSLYRELENAYPLELVPPPSWFAKRFL